MFWKWSLGLMQRIRMLVRERVACFLSCRKMYFFLDFFFFVGFFDGCHSLTQVYFLLFRGGISEN